MFPDDLCRLSCHRGGSVPTAPVGTGNRWSDGVTMLLHKLLVILPRYCEAAPLHLLPHVPEMGLFLLLLAQERTAPLPLPRAFCWSIFDTFAIAYPFLDAFLPEAVLCHQLLKENIPAFVETL